MLPRGFRKAVQEDRCRRSLIGRFRLPSLLASCFRYTFTLFFDAFELFDAFERVWGWSCSAFTLIVS